MGFTGKKAFKIKNDFIIRFSELEQKEQEKKKELAGSKGGNVVQKNKARREKEELLQVIKKATNILEIALEELSKCEESSKNGI